MFHIVDDIQQLREILQALMKREGYEAMTFDSAESYLDYVHSAEFSAPVAIFTDYMMPGDNGLELVKKVREILPLQKAVIISGTPSSELDADIESYLCYSLTKPFRAEKLYDLLQALVKCEHECHAATDGYPPRCKFELEHECPFFPLYPAA